MGSRKLIGLRRAFAGLLALVLCGCASVPLIYPEVVPPDSVPLRALQLDRPVVALVLGGGGSRGFAHVGAIKTLEAHGIFPDVVVGTSAGSFVGALYAGGYSGRALENIAFGLNEQDLRDVVFPDRGFVKGERLQDFVNQYLANRSIEELDRRFAAVATELRSGELTAFNRGNTGMAVRASSSIPGIFQPVQINGREYVDGGLVSPVPVKVARAMGADVVIAVDVSRKPEDSLELADTADILLQSIYIMGNTASVYEILEADVVIRPPVSEVGTLDFTKKTRAMEAGARAALDAVARILQVLSDAVAKKFGPPPPGPPAPR
ncbi:MAG: patatin-like phospholipase family protein [Betaproteobacteria bacterium]|nr:patatin-like phospholipase family protein [Betaproteobacteria bacterium]